MLVHTFFFSVPFLLFLLLPIFRPFSMANALQNCILHWIRIRPSVYSTAHTYLFVYNASVCVYVCDCEQFKIRACPLTLNISMVMFYMSVPFIPPLISFVFCCFLSLFVMKLSYNATASFIVFIIDEFKYVRYDSVRIHSKKKLYIIHAAYSVHLLNA